MKSDCTQLLHHINRLQGQLTRLQGDIQGDASCSDVVRLALSASKSFDALRAKIVEGYIERTLLPSAAATPQLLEELTTLYSLIKA